MASVTEPTLTVNVTRKPNSVLANTSRPSESVPNQFSKQGCASILSRLWREGSSIGNHAAVKLEMTTTANHTAELNIPGFSRFTTSPLRAGGADRPAHKGS